MIYNTDNIWMYSMNQKKKSMLQLWIAHYAEFNILLQAGTGNVMQ